MSSLRVFISINFDNYIKNKIYDCMQKLKQCATRGNFTRRENLHLTLVFIGETFNINALKKAMDTVCVSTFDININGFGCFHRDEGDIFWIGVEKNAVLNTIYNNFYSALKTEGFILETREFKPHVSLGRRVSLYDNFDINAFAKTIQPICMIVENISLMKSERVNSCLTYTEIYNKQLI